MKHRQKSPCLLEPLLPDVSALGGHDGLGAAAGACARGEALRGLGGQTVPIHNAQAGSVGAGHLFVAVLEASNNIYTEAFAQNPRPINQTSCPD